MMDEKIIDEQLTEEQFDGVSGGYDYECNSDIAFFKEIGVNISALLH